jgi:Na+/H+ antiporter NhaC
MRRRGTGRFALAVAVVAVLAQVGFSRVMALGVYGGWAGVIVALVFAGFALALIFTAIYDGPRSVAGLLRIRSRSF